MVSFQQIQFSTQRREHWLDITDNVAVAVLGSGIQHGICTVTVPHTTAAVTINENADPAVGRDVFGKLSELIPRQDRYEHAEQNSDSHLKAMLVGFSVQVPVQDGRPVLGAWQGIYLCEFDGPRTRTVMMTIQGDAPGKQH